MKNSTKMPTYHELMNPLIQALHELGGSGSIEEIAQKSQNYLIFLKKY